MFLIFHSKFIPSFLSSFLPSATSRSPLIPSSFVYILPSLASFPHPFSASFIIILSFCHRLFSTFLSSHYSSLVVPPSFSTFILPLSLYPFFSILLALHAFYDLPDCLLSSFLPCSFPTRLISCLLFRTALLPIVTPLCPPVIPLTSSSHHSCLLASLLLPLTPNHSVLFLSLPSLSLSPSLLSLPLLPFAP